MPVLKHKKPCGDCPWRRKSMAGWLGAGTPEEFVESVRSGDLPCHITIDYNDKDWRETQLPTAAKCAGALQFLNNEFFLSRDPDIVKDQDAVGQNPEVFDRTTEFIEHHRSRGMGSWDLVDDED